MYKPLAFTYRPICLKDFIGQDHLVGKDGPIKKFIDNKKIPSMIFWGPPGTGKTTLAYIISKEVGYRFYELSAVNSGKDKLREIIKSLNTSMLFDKQSILFIDEIHRWNKAQQDSLLPFVENGQIILIGATTENPSFSVISALLSRVKVFVFNQHSKNDIEKMLNRILSIEKQIKIEQNIISLITELANGDMRSAINILEMTAEYTRGSKKVINKDIVMKVVQKQLYYDKSGEEHYNIISAVHKSLRSSNGDAACYWIMRMLEGGEDPLYIARRLLRFASEDIGNADPKALLLAVATFDAVKNIGMPECDVFLMQLADYLAKAPKDNKAYRVSIQAKEDVKNYGNLSVPMHLRNAETKLMKDLGYGKGYEYDHDLISKKSKQQCMPDALKDRVYN